MVIECDFAVVGGGIAGASVAAELAEIGSVVLIEAEMGSGYHATGRSAASVGRAYGNSVIRALTDRSVEFFEAPPPGFSDLELVRARPWLFVAMPDQSAELLRLVDSAREVLRPLTAQEVEAAAPLLARGRWVGGALDASAMDIDVDALVQGYLRCLRRAGGETAYGARVRAIRRSDQGAWVLDCGEAQVTAPTLVNAAGAWADEVAVMAGLPGLGLAPMRRTAILVDAPDDVDLAPLPLVMDVSESFYLKPDAGLIMVSPADEIPSAACDAQPEEYDIALAAHLFETATQVSVRRVRRSWAGLRTFAPDRTPVVGFDPRTAGFFWLAGQGGYGVQTAPALARLAANLMRGDVPEADARLAQELSPGRFLRQGSAIPSPCV